MKYFLLTVQAQDNKNPVPVTKIVTGTGYNLAVPPCLAKRPAFIFINLSSKVPFRAFD